MSADAHVDDSDQLINALRGDVTRDELAVLTAHLRSCERCRDSLVEMVPVHASLAATARLLRPASTAAPHVVQPLEGHATSKDAATAPAAGADGGPLPPLCRDRGTRMRLVAAGAAAAVVLGTAVGVGIAARGDGSGGQPGRPGQSPASRSVALAPVTGDAAGQVTMTETRSSSGDAGQPAGGTSRTGTTAMRITTAGLSQAGPGQFYYAWLLDPATNKMLPLGVVSPGAPAQFQVSDDLVSRYHAVDISLQDDNGDPAHSPTSVLRARY